MAAIQVVTASQESQDTQVSKRCTHSGILNMPHFEVDADILRGIELEDSLRRLGKLWRESPLDLKIEDRTGLWEKSRPVQKYDVFLSHTWLTPGRWKVFSLLLQSGWKQMFAVWFFCISVVMTIGLLGWLPKPFLWRAGTLGFVTPTPFGPWMLATSFFSMILGLSVVPYMPAWCRKSSVCFLDVACIHQTDKDLMARGVYGLGGFLRQSAELRVLWSGPYLTRLWWSSIVNYVVAGDFKPLKHVETVETCWNDALQCLMMCCSYLGWWPQRLYAHVMFFTRQSRRTDLCFGVKFAGWLPWQVARLHKPCLDCPSISEAVCHVGMVGLQRRKMELELGSAHFHCIIETLVWDR